MVRDVFVDGFDQLGHAGEYAATQAFGCDIADCHLAPELWATCGQAEAALLAVIDT